MERITRRNENSKVKRITLEQKNNDKRQINLRKNKIKGIKISCWKDIKINEKEIWVRIEAGGNFFTNYRNNKDSKKKKW